jgi:hypothetical protein
MGAGRDGGGAGVGRRDELADRPDVIEELSDLALDSLRGVGGATAADRRRRSGRPRPAALSRRRRTCCDGEGRTYRLNSDAVAVCPSAKSMSGPGSGQRELAMTMAFPGEQAISTRSWR